MRGLMANLARMVFGQEARPGAGSEADDTLRVLAENSVDVICRIGPDLRASYLSPSAAQLFGYPPEEMVGRSPDQFIYSGDMPAVRAASALQFGAGQGGGKLEYRVVRRDGTLVWVEGSVRLLTDPVTGKPGDSVLVMRDITDRKALEDQLSTLALRDGLTGLANRRAFDTALAREWHRTRREGKALSLLLLDLDHFKQFNDHYGHQAGDDCLRAVAAAIRGATDQAADLVARYGGEEIVLILPGTDATGALDIAEQIRAAIAGLRLPHENLPDGQKLPGAFVTASIGVATAYARPGGSITMPEGLLMAADTALYKAKSSGRNRVATAMLLMPDDDVPARTPPLSA